MKKICFLMSMLVMMTLSVGSYAQLGKDALEVVEVDDVISAFSIGAQLTTYKGYQYLTYYDADHNMVMAKRKLGSKEWQKTKLPTKIGWDSHNYATFAFDRDGYIHLSGNMHCVPIIYFKSTKPESIDEFEVINRMTGGDEDRVTYPVFMTDGKGDLIFHYRSGGSGNGHEVYNIYDTKAKAWRRLIDTPLIDGKGERNAYMEHPQLGKDGYYHMVWVWRDSPDCSSNHTLSYARSRDLINWESIRGEKIELPILIDYKELVVDATPVKGGLLNGQTKLCFDSENRPIIGYFKYDKDANNQLYVTRFEDGEWRQSQLTDWSHRWLFEGRGSIIFELRISAPVVVDKNTMAFGYTYTKYGSGQILFDQKTLKPTGTRATPESYPKEYNSVQSKFLNMRAMVTQQGPYLLRWESLPANRDRKPGGELPPPSKLMLYKFR